ncbi:MAG: hypothetical protein CMJ30_00305 [Phycisphaerae bacterium]|jgi:two-component system cell cycle response regulator|nr:hypothetical protein [Phycisphaerae bacterium]
MLQPEMALPPPIPKKRRRPSVLLADADPARRGLLAHHLRQMGHEVWEATNAASAFELFECHHPPLLLVDQNLPAKGAERLLQHARELSERTPAIFAWSVLLNNQNDTGTNAMPSCDQLLITPTNHDALHRALAPGIRLLELLESLESEREAARMALETAHRETKRAQMATERMRRHALTDDLTRLGNRRAALDHLKDCWDKRGPLGVVMLDLDHFKEINDRFGHGVGDMVLEAVATRWRRCTRSGDQLYRMGGEEFLLLCPRADEGVAATAAERLRRALEEAPIGTDAGPIAVTLSAGVAARTLPMDSHHALLRAADRALYRAKNAGRNQIRRESSHRRAG